MHELLRTTDPTLIPFARALLSAEGIKTFTFDDNMSVMEGSLGILPRRLMVMEMDLVRARIVMRDNGIDVFEGEPFL